MQQVCDDLVVFGCVLCVCECIGDVEFWCVWLCDVVVFYVVVLDDLYGVFVQCVCVGV